jgi:endonuclease-3
MQLEQILTIFQEELPNPQIELNYCNHYTLLVAIVLSAQSTDVNVNKATRQLFAICDNPQSMIELGIGQLKDHIKTIGLYNNKAKNVIALSQDLISKHQGHVPSDFASLMALPGVGRKSANVFLANAYGAPTMGVDTHVARVAARLGLTVSSNPDKIEQDLLKAIAPQWLPRAHHWLVLHGRYTCKALKPLCHVCKIAHLCSWSR